MAHRAWAQDPPTDRGEKKARTRLLPGKEHWWWETEEPGDGGVLDDPELRAFWAAAPNAPAARCLLLLRAARR